MARASDRSDGRWTLIVLTALSVVMLVVGRDPAQQRRPGPLLTADVQAPVAEVVGAPLRALEARLATAADRQHALEENRALREELVRLRRDNQRLLAMQARLQRLEDTLSLRDLGTVPEPTVTARVVADPGSPFVRSLLLSAGQQQGVQVGDTVLSDSGLVGHVVSRGRRSARVLRLDDLNSRVAVMNADTGARAILVGANEAPPVLSFVADTGGWADGATVVTSGDDGLLPQGLPVGTAFEAGGAALRVRLDMNSAPLDWVLVLPVSAVAQPDDVELDDAELDNAEVGADGVTAGGGSGSADTVGSASTPTRQ